MKAGNKMLSSQFAELKQGIAAVADDARRAILEQKHQQLLIEAEDSKLELVEIYILFFIFVRIFLIFLKKIYFKCFF